MAVYAVGDIQGCTAELRQLLDRLRFDAACDRLWLTGDLVNRGPDSLGALRLARELGDSAVTVLGNHDLHLLAVAAGHAHRRDDAGLAKVLAAPDHGELLDWLRHRPLLHRDAALGWTLVHAGLAPQWSLEDAAGCAAEVEATLRQDAAALFAGMYGDEPRRWSPTLTGEARLRFIVNCMTRLRYVDADGALLLELKGAPGRAPARAIPWFRHPDSVTRHERVVFGHWSTLGYVRERGAMCLDGGCVWGGQLVAVRLDREGPPVVVDCAGYRAPGGR